MKVDSLVVYFPSGLPGRYVSSVEIDPSAICVDEVGVDFCDNSILPYIVEGSVATSFVGVPFSYSVKEAKGEDVDIKRPDAGQ